MYEFLTHFNNKAAIGLVAVLGGFALGFAGIAYCWFLSWQSHRRDLAVLNVKQGMIDRGYSPADICQVIEAGNTPAADPSVV